jgi:hypothetical protein
MPPANTTVQPYPPGTKWTITTRRGNFTQTEELVFYAEPNYSSITDDYRPDETSAVELWSLWVDLAANKAHEQWPTLYRPGEVSILWAVTTPGVIGIFEAAPFARTLPPNPELVKLFGPQENEDFLTHYRAPVNADTGEPINWLRLPVLDLGWNSKRADKGGFIQEATGWKPSPLQPTMDVVQIGRAAGLYVPHLP